MDSYATAGSQFGEGQLAAVRRREEAVRALFGPVEQARTAIGEVAVGRVLGLMQRRAPTRALEQVNAVDRDTARGGQRGDEQERRRETGEGDVADGVVFLAQVRAQRAVAAQHDLRGAESGAGPRPRPHG